MEDNVKPKFTAKELVEFLSGEETMKVKEFIDDLFDLYTAYTRHTLIADEDTTKLNLNNLYTIETMIRQIKSIS